MSDITTEVSHRRTTDGANANSLRSFTQQVALKTMQLGQVTLDLYAQGQLIHPALSPLCDELLAFEKQMMPAAHIEVIEEKAAVSGPTTQPPPSETVVPRTEEPAVTLAHCPQCQTVVGSGKKFCTVCGFRLVPQEFVPQTELPGEQIPTTPETWVPTNPITTMPPAALISPPSQTDPSSTNGKCVACGLVLQPGSAFCTNCGQPVMQTEQQPLASSIDSPLPLSNPAVVASPIAKYCENCGRGLPAEISVCPDCKGTLFDPA